MTRVAVVGCGYISRFHLQAWSRCGASVVAVCDALERRAQDRAAEFGIPVVRRCLADVLKHDTPDLVDIAAGPESHRSLIEEAMAAGVPVICQKPLAPSLAEAEAIVSAWRRVGVPFMVHENWRFRPWYRRIKSLLAAGAIGRPHYLRIGLRMDAVLPDVNGDAWLIRRQPYTGRMERLFLLEMGVHYIDMIRFLLGEFSRVCAETARVSPLVAGEDVAVVLGRAGGAIAVVDASWATVGGRFGLLDDLRIEGDRGTLETHQGGRTIQVVDAGGGRIEEAYAGSDEEAYLAAFVAAQAHFLECLRDGHTPETNGEDNLKTLAVMFAAYDAAASGRTLAPGASTSGVRSTLQASGGQQ